MPVHQRISVIMFVVAILSGCTSLPKEVNHPTEPLVSPLSSTLSKLAVPSSTEQPKQGTSAVLIQNSGWDALAQRLGLDRKSGG